MPPSTRRSPADAGKREVHERAFAWWRRRIASLPLILGIGVLLTICLLALDRDGFWITDNGARFIQLRGILASRFTDFSIPWPGAAIDPGYEFNPIPKPFSTVREGKLYSIWSPLFPALSAPFFFSFGYAGLYILPLLGGIFTLFGVARVTRILSRGQPLHEKLAVLIAALGTPLWFYSLVFWEHIIAACLVVFAVGFALEFLESGATRKLCAAAAVAVTGVYFRDELYPFVAVLGGFLIWKSPGKRLRTGSVVFGTMLLTMLPFWAFQWVAIGHPLGFHLAHGFHSSANSLLDGVLQHLKDRPRVFYSTFSMCSEHVWISILLTAPFCMLFLIGPRLRERIPLSVATLGLLASGIGGYLLFGFVSADSPMSWFLHSTGLFACSPILLFAFLRNGAIRRDDMIRAVSLLYVLAYALLTPIGNTQGLHWGNRYMLPVYPLLATLAAINIADWYQRSARRISLQLPPLVLAAGLSVLLQMCSIDVLFRKAEFSHHLRLRFGEYPQQYVVTTLWWLAADISPEFYERSIFFVRNREDLQRLRGRLSDAGIREYVLVDAPPANAGITIRDSFLNFFHLRVITVREGAPQNQSYSDER